MTKTAEGLTAAEAARRFGVAQTTIGAACRHGKIHGAHQGGNGRWWIPATAAANWVDLHRRQKAGEEVNHGPYGFRRGCRCRVCRCGQKSYSFDRYWRDPDTARRQARESRARHLDRVRDYEQRNRTTASGIAKRKRRQIKLDALGSRRGRWSEVEDVIALRTDISRTEKAVLLDRPYTSVSARIDYLRHRHQRIAQVENRRAERLASYAPATSGGRAWTEAELEMALDPVMSLEEKCQRLGRSYRSVQWKIRHPRVAPRTARGVQRHEDRPVREANLPRASYRHKQGGAVGAGWTPEEDALLLTSMSAMELSDALGRTLRSVYARRHRLKRRAAA